MRHAPWDWYEREVAENKRLRLLNKRVARVAEAQDQEVARIKSALLWAFCLGRAVGETVGPPKAP